MLPPTRPTRSSAEHHRLANRTYNDDVVNKRIKDKKTALVNSFGRIEKLPKFIANRQGEEIKSTLTLQTYVMRSNMEYLSFSPDSEAFKKAREFFQDVADVGVGG